jgi:hypothetical protein
MKKANRLIANGSKLTAESWRLFFQGGQYE